MAIFWWRSWHGAPTDHKWAVIAARANVKVGVVTSVAWALLDYASQQKDRGSVVGFDTEEYAIYSGFPEDEIKAVMQAMNDKAILVNGRFAAWEKRQPKREDDSSDRVRKHREMKRDVTQGNADIDEETHQSQSTESENREQRTEVEVETEEPQRPGIYEVYEQEVGPLSQMISDALDDISKTYPVTWFPEAVKEAKRSTTRVSLKYIEAILKRWKSDGKMPPPGQNHKKKTRILTGAHGETIEVEE